MPLLPKVRSFLRNVFLSRRVQADLDEEVHSHLAMLIEENVQAGMLPTEAMRIAQMELGGVEQVKEEVRDAQSGSWLDAVMSDCRFGFRQLRKNPGFTAVAVLTLALGIGASTTIFSVFEGVILKPLAYPHPEQLVSVELSPLALDPSLRGMAPEDYFVFREQSRTFQEIGLYAETDSDRDVNVTSFAEPERVHALHVTDGTLSALGIPPMLGRIFSQSDDSPGTAATAILTYGYWQRHFEGNPFAIGKTIIVDGKAREIIGVLPRNFRFLDLQDLALVLPLQLDRNAIHLGNFSYFGIGRLRAGSTLGQASAEVERMIPITLESFPAPPGISVDFLKKARIAPNLLPLKQDVVGDVGTLLWVLMGSIGMVLLIACANIANLLLVRTEGRQHEFALRATLGASRRRLTLQLFVEGAILGLLGSIFGLGLAYGALRLLVALAPAGLPRTSEIGVNLPVLLFTFSIAMLASLVFGLIPILKQTALRAGLSEGGRTLGLSRERHRARNILVTVQVALALVLLICSGLMIRTFRMLIHVDPGFVHPAEIQTFRIAIPDSDVHDEVSVPRLQQLIRDKLAAIPGVSAVGFSSAVPMDGDNRLDNVFAADHTYAIGEVPPLRHLIFVSPGYFQTLGIPLVTGRDLSWADTYAKIPVALISENFAREYWGSPAEALGKRIRLSSVDDWREIVGVVGDVRDEGMDKRPRAAVYWPTLLAKFQSRPLRAQRYVAFVVRSPLAGSEGLLKEIRQAVWWVDANLPLAGVYTLNHFYARSMARTSFTLVMLGIAAAMALILGTVGLYGVIAYTVAQRTHEIGIRMALGAQRSDAMRLVLGEGVVMVLIGLGIGLASSVALTRFLSSLLFGVTATDPLTFAVVAILLSCVALSACYVPARRALRIDPMQALRYE